MDLLTLAQYAGIKIGVRVPRNVGHLDGVERIAAALQDRGLLCSVVSGQDCPLDENIRPLPIEHVLIVHSLPVHGDGGKAVISDPACMMALLDVLEDKSRRVIVVASDELWRGDTRPSILQTLRNRLMVTIPLDIRFGGDGKERPAWRSTTK